MVRKPVQEARQVHELSEKRLQNFVQGSTYSEVLLSLESVALAQAGYLNSIRDYDKAQLRLLLLLGAGPADGNCSPRPVRRQWRNASTTANRLRLSARASRTEGIS